MSCSTCCISKLIRLRQTKGRKPTGLDLQCEGAQGEVKTLLEERNRVYNGSLKPDVPVNYVLIGPAGGRRESMKRRNLGKYQKGEGAQAAQK